MGWVENKVYFLWLYFNKDNSKKEEEKTDMQSWAREVWTRTSEMKDKRLPYQLVESGRGLMLGPIRDTGKDAPDCVT